MNESIRCFIAIEIPEEIQAALHKVISQAQLNRESGFRPVRPESIHLTLKFLGDVPKDRILAISSGIKKVCAEITPLTIQVRGLGVFPTWDRPRTVWAGLQYPSELTDIFRKIDEVTSHAGFPGETRGFSPHLTLARASERGDPQTIKQRVRGLQSLPESLFGEVTVNQVTFFKSLLQQGGSVYEVISTYPFSGEKV